MVVGAVCLVQVDDAESVFHILAHVLYPEVEPLGHQLIETLEIISQLKIV